MKRILSILKQKWPEYILEILVITIGILGAFALNTWNENRKTEKLERDILVQIKADLENNQRDISGDLGWLELSYTSAQKIKGYLDKDLPYQPEFCFDFYFLIQDEFTTPNTAGYQNLKDYGMNLISNDSLVTMIRVIYERALPRLSPNTAFHEDLNMFYGSFYDKHFIPNADSLLRFSVEVDGELITFPRLPQEEGEIIPGREVLEIIGFIPLDFKALKSDPEFRMLLKRSERIRNHKLMWYRRSKKLMDRTILEIEKELEKL